MNGVNITISATPTTNRVPGDSLTLSDLAAFVEVALAAGVHGSTQVTWKTAALTEITVKGPVVLDPASPEQQS